MKIMFRSFRFTTLTRPALLLALGAGLVALNVNLGAQDKDRLEELRLQAKRLQEQAADKKAEGAHEDARRLAEQAEGLMREARELKQQAAERERPEKGELKEQAERRERLKAKIKELEAAGKTEEALRLKRSLDEFAERQAHERRPERPGGADLERMHRQLEELIASGRREEAEALKRRIAELEARPRPDRELADVKERLARLPGEIAGLRKEGHHEEAGRLEQEGRRLRARLEEGERHQRPQDPRPEGRETEEIQRRLEHLRTAVGNLHAAGMHEPAEQLARQAEAMERYVRPRPERGGTPPERAEAVIRELRQEVQALRQELQELRKRLDEQGKERR